MVLRRKYDGVRVVLFNFSSQKLPTEQLKSEPPISRLMLHLCRSTGLVVEKKMNAENPIVYWPTTGTTWRQKPKAYALSFYAAVEKISNRTLHVLSTSVFTPPSIPSSFPLATMSDTIKEIVDIPQNFFREGTHFVNRCTKPNRKGIHPCSSEMVL